MSCLNFFSLGTPKLSENLAVSLTNHSVELTAVFTLKGEIITDLTHEQKFFSLTPKCLYLISKTLVTSKKSLTNIYTKCETYGVFDFV